MTQYTKEFREQAILLSDEIGVKKSLSNSALFTAHYLTGEKEETQCERKNKMYLRSR